VDAEREKEGTMEEERSRRIIIRDQPEDDRSKGSSRLERYSVKWVSFRAGYVRDERMRGVEDMW
jgi:hypothetical protein